MNAICRNITRAATNVLFVAHSWQDDAGFVFICMETGEMTLNHKWSLETHVDQILTQV